LEVDLDRNHYFKCGNTADLRYNLEKSLEQGINNEYRNKVRALLRSKYDWQNVAMQTIDLYKALIKTAV